MSTVPRETQIKKDDSSTKMKFLEEKCTEAEDKLLKLKAQHQEEISKLKEDIERKDHEIILLKELENPVSKAKHNQSKLAGMYANLYINQWTEAYEIVEGNCKTEQEISDILLQILQNVRQFCEIYASKQLMELQGVLGYSNTEVSSDFPESVILSLKECMRKASTRTVKNMYERYLVHQRRSSSEIAALTLKVASYVNGCFEVCWLMAIEDPPVVFAPVAVKDEKVNSEMYSFYTKSGSHVDYTVWPALLQYKDGPVLEKGVVQGFGDIPRRR